MSRDKLHVANYMKAVPGSVCIADWLEHELSGKQDLEYTHTHLPRELLSRDFIVITATATAGANISRTT